MSKVLLETEKYRALRTFKRVLIVQNKEKGTEVRFTCEDEVTERQARAAIEFLSTQWDMRADK